MSADVYFVSHWQVTPRLNQICHGDECTILEPKLIEVLSYLASNPNTVFSRVELKNALWRGEVSDGAVNRIIAQLRKALKDDSQDPKFIQTIPKQGYRLIAPVKLSTPTKSNRRLPYIVPLILLSCCVLLFAAIKYNNYFKESVDNPSLFLSPLTSKKGSEFGASFSINGKYLVYVHQANSSSSHELIIREVANNKETKLINSEWNISTPKLSHDNKKLAYFKKKGAQCFLMLISLNDNGNVISDEELAKCDPEEHYASLAWLAGSNELVYIDRQSNQHPYLIHQLSISTKRIQTLAQVPDGYYGDYHLAISPTGKQLAILRSQYWDNSELFILDLDSYKMEKVWQFDFLLWSVSWSADNQSIIYSNGQSPGTIFKLDLTDKLITSWYSAAGFLFNPTPTYSNTDIVYNQIETEVDLWQLAINRLDNKPQLLTELNSSFIEENPRISSDGNSIVFLSNRSGTLQLWLSRLGKLSPLLKEPLNERLDAYIWLPDNKQLIVQTGSSRLIIIDSFSGKHSYVETKGDNAVHPSISNDKQRLYYSSDVNGDWQIWRQSLTNELPPELVTPAGGYSAQESTDNKSLIYTKYRQLGIWQLNLSNKVEKLLIADTLRRTEFKQCESDLFYTMTENEHHQIWKYNLKTKLKALVFEKPYQQQLKFDFNGDCSQLYFSFWQSESNLMIIRDN
jgi:DNA-binding winged helix-turn-helix (wHTH) protein/Tol biopolymer transport system component